MSNINKTKNLYNRRKIRTRYKISKSNRSKRIRLSVFRSGRHIYGQFIDDVKGVTIASASSISKIFEITSKNRSNIEAAKQVGALLASEAKKQQILLDQIVFDRGGYLFHGRVKALIEAVKENLN